MFTIENRVFDDQARAFYEQIFKAAKIQCRLEFVKGKRLINVFVKNPDLDLLLKLKGVEKIVEDTIDEHLFELIDNVTAEIVGNEIKERLNIWKF